MLGSIHLLPDPKAQVGRPVDLGMPSPIVGGESKGLEEDGKMMPKDLPPSEDRHPIERGHLARQKGRRDARVMTKAAK